MAGDRHLILEHNVMNGVLLAESDADQVLQHLADIWSYDVCLNQVYRATGMVLKERRAKPRHQARFCRRRDSTPPMNELGPLRDFALALVIGLLIGGDSAWRLSLDPYGNLFPRLT